MRGEERRGEGGAGGGGWEEEEEEEEEERTVKIRDSLSELLELIIYSYTQAPSRYQIVSVSKILK